MVEKLDEMESKLNEQIEKNVSLNKRLAESVAGGIDQVSEGLAQTQKKARLLLRVLSLVKKNIVKSWKPLRNLISQPRNFPHKTETLSEGVDSYEIYSGSMAKYENLRKF